MFPDVLSLLIFHYSPTSLSTFPSIYPEHYPRVFCSCINSSTILLYSYPIFHSGLSVESVCTLADRLWLLTQ